ncbi:MAG: hypothetical protein Q9209_001503 [Squamulea sp. 1 TL-2023]
MTGMADKSAAFVPIPCHVETSVRAISGTDEIKRTPIIADDQISVGFEVSSLPIDVVHGAWAILLRSYPFSDTISFGTLSGYQDEGTQGFRDMYDVSIEVEDARVCQYHAVSERNWGEWLTDVYKPISGETLQEIQINTAIQSWVEQRNLKPQRPRKYIASELTQIFDVVLNVNSNDWPRSMSLQYRSPQRCDSYTRSIARNFQTILVEIAFKGGHSFGWINSISKRDTEKIQSWNARELYTNPGPLHHLIEVAALSKPDAEAVCAWDGSMTYAELDAISSNVARQLIRAGVCLGDMIPFAFEKSMWTVVSILAILKAGGAFVPLLPTHPKRRLQDIMTSVRAKLVVTSAQYKSLFADLGASVFEVSAQTAYIQPNDGKDVRFPSVGPRDVVFVLFTSGSTGKPKGVVHEHGPISTHAVSHGEGMGYHNARVIQFAAHVFDLSILDMTTPLIFGGCVCIPSEEDRVNNLPEAMNHMMVDLALLTPSVASLLRPADINTLKTLICCGECYREEIPRRWKGRIRLLNSYGPAETQFTHLRHIERDNETTRPLSVGPLLPTAICVLVDPNNHNHLVPIGAIGELLVAATTLARGYLNDEEKTRSAFITNPAWSADMGFQDLVFYKTGDLLRYNVGSFDGQFDFVGRKDTQIKIHGQRVEAGEIEHHLAQVSGLEASAVVFPSQGCFSGQLIAVVQMGKSSSARFSTENITIDLDQPLSMDTVRLHHSKILPDYAIPSECLTIEKMPLTTSGKIDRRTVESWLSSLVSRPLAEEHVEAVCDTSPLDEKETTAYAISAIVADMIASRDPEQGLQFRGQDFVLHQCGIDSIEVMSLSMFIRKSYGVKIPMEHLHSSSSTVRQLAYLIDRENEPVDNGTSDLDLDLSKEIALHTEELLVNIKPKSTGLEIRRVFLTGASGYLGSGTLCNLLSQPSFDIYALIRCSSAAEGLDIISRKAKAHGEQGACIDTIIHNGARVHYNTDYHGLKAINLHPTKELLALSTGSPNISTFVYVTGGRRHTFEEDETEHALRASHTNGYSQSKFVAESIVRKCMNHTAFASKNLHIIQPGYIIGSPRNGIANLTDFIWRLVTGCLEIGAYNADESTHWLFMADVDRVAEAITQPLFNQASNNRNSTNRIRDGFPFSTLWHILEHDFGYTLHPLPQDEWLSRIEATVLAKGSIHNLFPLLATLEKAPALSGRQKKSHRSTQRLALACKTQ